MKEIIIREARISDLAQLKSLEQALIKAERPFDPTIREDPVVYYNLERMLESKDYHVVVAEENGNIVSTGYGVSKPARSYLDHQNYAYLGFMYTVPAFRGRGINKMIIDSLKKWAFKNGLDEIRLTVYENNTPAIKAYEKAGFKNHIVEMRIT